MPSSRFSGFLQVLISQASRMRRLCVEFCEQMENVKLEEGDELLSFDVVSLFLSIPVDLAIQVATDVLCNDETLQDRYTIPVGDIVDLLDFCLSKTNFKYNKTYYQQIFGTAMGSPVSDVMANLVMEDLEKRALSTSIVQPCFWKRYVDDVCAAVNSSLVQTLQHHLNNIEPSIQFTVERETDRKISFLDVTVCRQDNGRLSTKIYRKPTHTEIYLSFHSHHYPGARGFFLVGGDRIEPRLRVAKRREKNLWYQRITTSLPCRRQFPLIDIRKELILETQQTRFTHARGVKYATVTLPVYVSLSRAGL